MVDDVEFLALLSNWNVSTKLTNMATERLLASIKGAAMTTSVGVAPDVERVCSAGHLIQWLTEHFNAKGDDPRITTRRQLVADDVPLQCTTKRRNIGRTKTKPAGGFVVFQAQRRRQRLSTGQKLNKDAAKLEREDLRSEWSTFDLGAKKRYLNIARGEHNQAELGRLQRDLDGEPVENPTLQYNSSVLWGLGSKASPLSVENFEQVAKNICGEESLPGSRRYCTALRDDMRRSMCVKEEGQQRRSR